MWQKFVVEQSRRKRDPSCKKKEKKYDDKKNGCDY